MRRASLCAMTVFFTVSMASAAPTLRLTSPANLQALQVSQTVTFEVRVSGFESGQELDSLGATICYTDHLGSSAITPAITPSGIIPSSGTFLSDGVGQASVSFLGTDTDYISGSGLFFSFDTVVQHTGAGHLWFDYADASQVNPAIYFSSSDEEHPLYCYCGPETGSELEFNVVPEPSQWVLMMAAGLTAAAYFLKRRVLVR